MKLRPIVSAAMFALLPLISVQAAEPQEIAKMAKQGQYAQALERADKFLAANPKDAQVRFQKGLILAEMNRTPEAIKVFTALSEEYPELPEPYNNLAVLYASQNQYDKARQALEMAIQTHPSYAVAHENLGDIYAKLASQAYDKALQLDKGNNNANTKLALIRDLFSRTGKVLPSAAPLSAPAPAVAAKPAVPAPAVVAKPTPAPAPAPVPAPVAAPAVINKPAEKPATASTPESKPEPAKPAEPERQTKTDDAVADDVLRAVNSWAQAWSDRKVGAYLDYYGKSFRPPNGEPRNKWEDARRDRISRAKRIDVGILQPQVRLESADRAVVSFTQRYSSDALKSTTGKTLVLNKTGGRWQIVEERLGR
ncbi:tetratricopeptide (TPR) repeat protein [Chitinivorax tropicus]|uniref:Tetratricopeptide (TPR) repeat protein n=1 Tax=Chitinivorax tropicus TaxID=714531 RepID=A0A840MJZ4_9PROT|nr:tetratricopeptide repeat protein [Chitinivorax tropicus]MBB5019514.1 tetratricopeptide (TPR) repeat protein [Chitinivorax tropicus]